jgi:autotransporter-associated beta strand protein
MVTGKRCLSPDDPAASLDLKKHIRGLRPHKCAMAHPLKVGRAIADEPHLVRSGEASDQQQQINWAGSFVWLTRADSPTGIETAEILERAAMTPQASHSSHQTATTRAAIRHASLRAILLATSALATAALPMTAVRAADGDSTWQGSFGGDPNPGDFEDPLHWSFAVPTGTATFNANDTRNITFNDFHTLGGIKVTSGAGDYTFNTNGFDITFNGAGFSVGSGASLTLNVNGNSTAVFEEQAKAGTSTLNIGDTTSHTGGTVNFNGGSSAEQATINVSSFGSLNFNNNSSAGSATIAVDGDVFFSGAATGGTARMKLNGNGFLDITGLDGTAVHPDGTSVTGVTLGSIESNSADSAIFLGDFNLTVGGDGRTTTFAGRIVSGSDGSLTKEGTGALTLTGDSFDFRGATTVNGGALIVDGDIGNGSGVTVNAGATLGGGGFVSATTIEAGGTLAPGGGAGSTLTVLGDLTFSPGSTYLVQVSSLGANNTSVDGGATLGGATVAANFAPGMTVTRQQYTILVAHTLTDTFSSQVKTNLSPIFKTSLSYDDPTAPTSVFLNVDIASPSALAGLNTNQRNVGNALINAFNATGSLPGAFATLGNQGLTQVSGETAVGTQQATFDAMNQFMGVLLDPTAGALSGARAKDAYASMPRKAPMAEPFDARWGVWAAGYGGSQSTSGDANLGSNKTTSNVFGSAVGADYRFSPNTVAGFALAGGGTHFNVANGGSGNSDLFQAGAYLRHAEGAAFIAAALAYGWQDVTTNRTVTAAGIDSLRANFKTNAISGRLEGGYRVVTGAGDITPYAAAQFTNYRLPSYMEQVAFGAGTFALNYAGKDVTASRSELGLKAEKAVPMTDATLMLRGRLAWAHDFNTDRNVQATFQSLPGASFVVNGATPAADAALTTISAETLWRNGWSASVTADAQLSDTTQSYSGKGVVRYSW